MESVLVLHLFVNKMPSSSSFFNLSNLPYGNIFCIVQPPAGIYASYTGKLSAIVENVLVLYSFVNKMPSIAPLSLI